VHNLPGGQEVLGVQGGKKVVRASEFLSGVGQENTGLLCVSLLCVPWQGRRYDMGNCLPQGVICYPPYPSALDAQCRDALLSYAHGYFQLPKSLVEPACSLQPQTTGLSF
jgi:hypothetical protein